MKREIGRKKLSKKRKVYDKKVFDDVKPTLSIEESVTSEIGEKMYKNFTAALWHSDMENNSENITEGRYKKFY